MACNTRSRFGQIAALAAGMAVALSGMVAIATPAAAATAPPWHWSQVTGSASLTWFSTQTVALQCPSGYVPISGGFTQSDSSLIMKAKYADTSTNQYVIVLSNATGATHAATLTAWCVLGSDLGEITTSSVNSYTSSSNHRNGYMMSCPRSYTVLDGGAYWASTVSRTLDFSGPVGSTSWYVSGSSTASDDTLTSTIRCMPYAAMNVQVVDVHAPASNGLSLTATCPYGTRIMNGGSYVLATSGAYNQYTDFGYSWASQPDRHSWTSSLHAVTAGEFHVTAECVQAATPWIQVIQRPLDPTNSTDGQFNFTASDPVGDPLTITCTIDGNPVTCASGSSLAVGGLSEGSHAFIITAVNADGQQATSNIYWHVDLTPPTNVSALPAGANVDVGAVFDARFSEAMKGITATTFQVIPDGGAPALSGVVSYGYSATCGCARATFTPSAPLRGHQGYTAQLKAGITDLAGNALAPVSWHLDTADGEPSCTDVPAGTAAVNTSLPVGLTCTDPDTGDALTYTVVTPPAHGTVGDPDGAGALTYMPDPGYVGPDTFTYRAADAYGGIASPATVTLSVGPDHDPVCQDVSKPIGYESADSVALDCSDVDTGQAIGYAVDTAPAHGGLGTPSGDGQVVYTPYPGYSGEDSFTYHATDLYGGQSAVRTVTLNVAPNAAPTCAAKSVSVSHATALSIPLSCSDPDTGQTVTLSLVTSPSHGSLSMTDATHATYRPASSFGGTDSFTYKGSDGRGGESAPATVTLHVAPGATLLSLKAGALTLVKGKTDRLTGRLRDKVTGAYVNGRTVLLQFRRSTTSSWTTVAKTATARVGTSSGVAKFSVSPRRSCYYRLVFRGSSAYRSSTSSAVHVRVT